MVKIVILLAVVASILAEQSRAFLSVAGSSKGLQRRLIKGNKLVTKHATMGDDKVASVVAEVKQRVSKRALGAQIATVALPALAVCIVEPALSLIDMYFVGTSTTNSALALAAMSVNGAVFNIIAAATAPLCTGTTAVVSRSLGSGSAVTNNKQEEGKLGTVLINGLFLSFTLGAVISTFLHIFGHTILKNGFGLQAEALQMALSYLRIRALALPFALITYVVIGFSLGIQNAWTPMISILISSLVNVVGDFALTARGGMGLVGAAWATALATLLAALITSQDLIRKYFGFSSNERIRDTFKRMANKLQVSQLKDFFSTSSLLFCGSFINTLTYSAGARVSTFVGASPVSSVVQVAAHQVVLQLWWFISYFSSAISLAAQSILPKEVNAKHTERYTIATRLLIRTSTVIAMLCTLLLSALLRKPGLFTTDLIVQQATQGVSKEALGSMFVICLTTALDGIFIGYSKLLTYIGASVVSTASAWAYYLFRVIPQGRGVKGTWEGLLIFSLARLTFYVLAALKSFKKTIQLI